MDHDLQAKNNKSSLIITNYLNLIYLTFRKYV